MKIRNDNHLLDAECLAHIVVDPEWPGGGLNLVRSNPRPEGLPKKQPERRIRNVAYERPSWLGDR